MDWEVKFESYKNLYSNVLERLWLKTMIRAKNKTFAETFFLHSLKFEIEHAKGYYFEKQFIELFEIYFQMGYSWSTFLKEINLYKDAFLFTEVESTIENYIQLKIKYNVSEINRMKIEAKLFQDFSSENTIVDQMQSVLFMKLLIDKAINLTVFPFVPFFSPLPISIY